MGQTNDVDAILELSAEVMVSARRAFEGFAQQDCV